MIFGTIEPVIYLPCIWHFFGGKKIIESGTTLETGSLISVYGAVMLAVYRWMRWYR
jgi:hypothetical protein